jgi:hypothetical protein
MSKISQNVHLTTDPLINPQGAGDCDPKLYKLPICPKCEMVCVSLPKTTNGWECIHCGGIFATIGGPGERKLLGGAK